MNFSFPIAHKNKLYLLLILAAAGLRLYYCFETPRYTTDVLRNLGYGLEFQHYGFRVYEYAPFDFSPELYQYFWSNRKYSYPAVTLIFYAGLCAVWASIFFAKLIFTLIDFANAWLFYKISKEPGCAVFYLCFPDAIWFGSHEGQFEPLVNLFILLAIYFLNREKPISFFFLSLGVQSKMFPVFLLPYFFMKLPYRAPARCIPYFLWGLVSLAPSVVAGLYSDYPFYLFRGGYIPQNNPTTWAIFDVGYFAFNPFWLVFSHWIAGIVFVGACLWFMRQEQRMVPYLAPLVFVVFVKANLIGQFWYFILVPAMCMTVENARHRRILLGLSLLFNVRSLWSLFLGPVGYQNPGDVMRVLEMGMWGV